MQKYTFTNTENGTKLIKFLLNSLETRYKTSDIHKALRNKDVKINNSRVKDDCLLKEGDIVDIFLPDAAEKIQTIDSYERFFKVVYEDDNILVVDKVRGICVHMDTENAEPNLIDELNKYAGNTTISLCHRIDRNTGGLVIAAKKPDVLKEMFTAIENHQVRKCYQAIVHGVPVKKSDKLINYLSKNEDMAKVFIKEKRGHSDVTAITNYHVIRSSHEISLLEIEIETGRMHQIRAQFAHAGFPIIGDGKYGSTIVNRKFKEKKQLLFAYKLIFDFDKNSKLSYLNSKVIEIDPGLLKRFEELSTI